MLKKNETIEILKNGGCIEMDEFVRRAHVYTATGEYLGVCRYDTAQNLGRLDGYRRDYGSNALVSIIRAVEETPAAVTADFGVRACVAEIENMIDRGENAGTIAANLIECDMEQGPFFNQKMWTAFDILFPDFPVSREIMGFYWNECKHDENDGDRRRHIRRLICTHAAQVEEERTQTAQEAAAVTMCEICGDEIPAGEDFRDDLGRCCCCHCFADRAAEQGHDANEISGGTLEQPAARVAVRDPETEEILEGSPRAIYHAIAYRVRYARRYQEDSPAWEPVTDNAARIIAAAHAVTRGPARAAVLARATVRGYKNHRTQEQTQAAAVALQWHRAGDLVTVARYVDGQTAKYTTIRGARAEKPTQDENRDHCRHIAQELEKYAAGDVARCPECGEIHEIPETVGDKFRCPSCGAVEAVEDWETLGIWDFLADSYDIEYRCGSDREYRSVRVMVACGGPNIFIDTAEKAVLLYWWTDSARYSLDPAAVEAVDEWAQEYWNL